MHKIDCFAYSYAYRNDNNLIDSMKRKTMPLQRQFKRTSKKNKTQMVSQLQNQLIYMRYLRREKSYKHSQTVIEEIVQDIEQQINAQVQAKANEELLDMVIEDIKAGYEVLSSAVCPFYGQVCCQQGSLCGQIKQDNQPCRNSLDHACGFDKVIPGNKQLTNYQKSESRQTLNSTSSNKSTLKSVRRSKDIQKINLTTRNLSKLLCLNTLTEQKQSSAESSSQLIPLGTRDQHYYRSKVYEKIPFLPQIDNANPIINKRAVNMQKSKDFLVLKNLHKNNNSYVTDNLNGHDVHQAYDYDGNAITVHKNRSMKTENLAITRTNVLKTTCKLIQKDKRNKNINQVLPDVCNENQRRNSIGNQTANHLIYVYDNINRVASTYYNHHKLNNTTGKQNAEFQEISSHNSSKLNHRITKQALLEARDQQLPNCNWIQAVKKYQNSDQQIKTIMQYKFKENGMRVTAISKTRYRENQSIEDNTDKIARLSMK